MCAHRNGMILAVWHAHEILLTITGSFLKLNAPKCYNSCKKASLSCTLSQGLHSVHAKRQVSRAHSHKHTSESKQFPAQRSSTTVPTSCVAQLSSHFVVPPTKSPHVQALFRVWLLSYEWRIVFKTPPARREMGHLEGNFAARMNDKSAKHRRSPAVCRQPTQRRQHE